MSFAVALVAAAACGTTGPVDLPSKDSSDAGPFPLSGYVLKGPVSGATVAAFKLHADLTTGDTLATATTDESGVFGLTLPPYNGDVLLGATPRRRSHPATTASRARPDGTAPVPVCRGHGNRWPLVARTTPR